MNRVRETRVPQGRRATLAGLALAALTMGGAGGAVIAASATTADAASSLVVASDDTRDPNYYAWTTPASVRAAGAQGIDW